MCSISERVKIGLQLLPALTLEQFIKINEKEFNDAKKKEHCFCTFHNEIVECKVLGISFNPEELREFYSFCVGRHNKCDRLKDTISCLAKDEAVKAQFLKSFS